MKLQHNDPQVNSSFSSADHPDPSHINTLHPMPLFLSYMFAFRAVILSFVPLSPVRTAKFASQLMVTDGNDVHASVVRSQGCGSTSSIPRTVPTTKKWLTQIGNGVEAEKLCFRIRRFRLISKIAM